MNVTEYLLICLAEEATELAQAAMKALQFGLAEGRDPASGINATRINQEFTDLVTVMDMLTHRNSSITTAVNLGEKAAKMRKVWKYLEYYADLGIVEQEKS